QEGFAAARIVTTQIMDAVRVIGCHTGPAGRGVDQAGARVHHVRHGQPPQSERRWKFWLQQASRAQSDLVEYPAGAIVQQRRRIARKEIDAEDRAGHCWMHEKVDW